MCQTAITLISKALNEVDNAEVLLKIKGVIALFIQTMDVSSFEMPLRAPEFGTDSAGRVGDIQ